MRKNKTRLKSTVAIFPSILIFFVFGEIKIALAEHDDPLGIAAAAFGFHMLNAQITLV